ncbi:MAG: ISL3 family transposase [Algisphaera sp.]
MNNLQTHYRMLLGLDDAWIIDDIQISLEDQRIQIQLKTSPKANFACPDCQKSCSLKDHAPVREWRHLDTMQFETLLVARLPRTRCPDCGVKTIAAPWGTPHGRFTLMFEAFAIRVLQAAASVQQACVLLRIDWNTAQTIMDRAVARGLKRRDLTELKHVGIDEKSFGKNHKYISLMTDIDASRVLEVTPGHDESSADVLWDSIGEETAHQVEAVAMDMWWSFENSTSKKAPQAAIVHDRFHISKMLNDGVDKVRKQEHRLLLKENDKTLTGTKYLWVSNPENLNEKQWASFESIKDLNLKTSRAWAIREQFRFFWEYTYTQNARKFFKKWWHWVARCQLKPMKIAGKAIHRRLDRVLTWFKHPISNGPSEGFNSRIQSIKSAARGFRKFENYRTRILFFCGKLDLLPEKICH